MRRGKRGIPYRLVTAVFAVVIGFAGMGITSMNAAQAQTQDTQDAQESISQTQTARETWTAQTNGITATVSGMLPVGGRVSVEQVDAEVPAQDTLIAVDITIYDAQGAKWEPTGQTISVQLTSNEIEPSSSTQVWHIPDNGETEKVSTGSAVNGQVSFGAKSFSVYVVTVPSSHFTRTYRFLNEDGTVLSTQVLSDDETLLTPPTVNGPGAFAGWFTSDGTEFTGFNKTARELYGKALDSDAQNSPVDLTAHFEGSRRHLVKFMSADPVPVVAEAQWLSDDDHIDGYKVLDLVNPYSVTKQIVGWSRDRNATEPDADLGTPNGQDVVLWPVVHVAYFITFDSNGGSAVRTQYVNQGDVTTKPADPQRAGYTFAGWANADGSPFTFGNPLVASTHVVAQWTANTDTTYHVNYWVQNSSDAVDAADADKTYTFYSTKSFAGVTHSQITPAMTDIANETQKIVDAYSGHVALNAVRSDSAITIAADGSSVLNIYLDRGLMRINFYETRNDADADPDKTSVENYAETATGLIKSYLGLYGQKFDEIEPGEGNRWQDADYWYLRNPTSFSGSNKHPEASRRDFWKRSVTLPKLYAFFTQNTDGNGYTSDEKWTNFGLSFTFTERNNSFNIVRYGLYTPSGQPVNPQDLDANSPDIQWMNVTDQFAGVTFTQQGLYNRLVFDSLASPYLIVERNRVPHTITLMNAATAVTVEELISSENRLYGASLSDIAQKTPPRPQGLPDYYEFDGWYRDSDFSYPVTDETVTSTRDMTLFAHWVAKHLKVTFNPHNGEESTVKTVEATSTVYEPSIADRPGYVLTGWTTPDGRAYNFDNPVTQDLVLNAKWVKRNAAYSISYDLAGGTGTVVDDDEYSAGATVRAQDAASVTPPADSIGFAYWVNDDGTKVYPGDTVTMPEHDIVLRAVWATNRQVHIAYDLNYEGAPQRVYTPDTNSNSHIVIEHSDPTREGYKFLGWSVNKDGEMLLQQGDVIQADSINQQNNVLYAQWQKLSESDSEIPSDTEPDTEIPDETEPDTEIPDETEPDTEIPDETEPDTETPDETEPDTETSDKTETTGETEKDNPSGESEPNNNPEASQKSAEQHKRLSQTGVEVQAVMSVGILLFVVGASITIRRYAAIKR